LIDLELQSIPRLYVMNKSDRVEDTQIRGLCRRYEAVAVSALRRKGLDRLIQTAETVIKENKGGNGGG
jgi:50S ribosomal subunit-associated GTPase HflX